MSKKFYAQNRITGERWKPDKRGNHQYLMMYDSGYLAVVTDGGWDGHSVRPLDNMIWEVVNKVHK